MFSKTTHDWNRVLFGAIVAGLVAGLALEIVLVLMSLATHQDVWMSMKGAGSPFLGPRAHAPGFDAAAVFVGVVSHLTVSVGWAVPFALFVDGASTPITLVFGGLWGMVVWIVMYYAVLPIVGLGRVARSTPVSFAVVLHVFFGFALALAYLPFQRTRRTPPRVAAAH